MSVTLSRCVRRKLKMSPRDVFRRASVAVAVVLFALQNSLPTAEGNCKVITTPQTFALGCKKLVLMHMNLTTFELTQNLSKLNNLELHRNQITNMPRLPASVKATLDRLDVSYNKIAYVPANYFNGFKSFTKFNMIYNDLTEMPALPDDVKPNIELLNVCYNKISAIPSDYFNGFRNLTLLTIHRNRFTRFAAGTSFKHLKRLTVFLCNKLVCDCATIRALQGIDPLGLGSYSTIQFFFNDTANDHNPCTGALANTTYKQLKTMECEDSVPLNVSSSIGVRGGYLGDFVVRLVLCRSLVLIL